MPSPQIFFSGISYLIHTPGRLSSLLSIFDCTSQPVSIKVIVNKLRSAPISSSSITQNTIPSSFHHSTTQPGADTCAVRFHCSLHTQGFDSAATSLSHNPFESDPQIVSWFRSSKFTSLISHPAWIRRLEAREACRKSPPISPYRYLTECVHL